MLHLVKRDSKIVADIYETGVRMTAIVQVSKIDVKPNYTNIAIQKITFRLNGIEYQLDHVWLQERDYVPKFKTIAKEGEWYKVDFTFYQYRNKITKNEQGRMMHGMTITSVRKMSKKKGDKMFGSKFNK